MEGEGARGDEGRRDEGRGAGGCQLELAQMEGTLQSCPLSSAPSPPLASRALNLNSSLTQSSHLSWTSLWYGFLVSPSLARSLSLSLFFGTCCCVWLSQDHLSQARRPKAPSNSHAPTHTDLGAPCISLTHTHTHTHANNLASSQQMLDRGEVEKETVCMETVEDRK